VILAVIAYFVLTGGRYQVTDNAYVQIAKVPVAPFDRRAGHDIYVHENQVVRRGQVLFRPGRPATSRPMRRPPRPASPTPPSR
jgi:membrane fusion protein (multidrug efflux system)